MKWFLYRSVHSKSFLMAKRIYIQPADSWHQPSKASNSTTENEPCTELDFTLLKLNDDCLLYLFKFFNIMDIIYLSKTCARLHALTEPILMKCETFTLQSETPSDLSLMNVRTQLSNLGTYIRSLTINGDAFKSPNHPRYLELVYRNCLSLEELHLQEVTFLTTEKPYRKEPKLKDNMAPLKNLKVLELIKCDGVNDRYLMEKLGSNCELTELKLIGCGDIVGLFFTYLKKLRKIYLHRCLQVEIVPLKNLFKTNIETLTHVTLMRMHTNLSILELVGKIRNLEHLQTDEAIQRSIFRSTRESAISLDEQLANIKLLYIPTGFENVAPIMKELRVNNKQIEELDLSFKELPSADGSKSDLLQLTTLQVLKLNETSGVDTSFLLDCVKSLTNLRVLCCRKANISDLDVVNIVQNAAKLTDLDIVDCTKVTYKIGEKLEALLKTQCDRPKLKLKISYFEESDLVSVGFLFFFRLILLLLL